MNLVLTGPLYGTGDLYSIFSLLGSTLNPACKLLQNHSKLETDINFEHGNGLVTIVLMDITLPGFYYHGYNDSSKPANTVKPVLRQLP